MLLVVRSSDSQGSQLINLFICDEFSVKTNTEDVLLICQERQNFLPAKFEERDYPHYALLRSCSYLLPIFLSGMDNVTSLTAPCRLEEAFKGKPSFAYPKEFTVIC